MRKENKMSINNIKDIKSRYYIRFMAQDSPGVLADVSKILASFNISIASVSQKEQKSGKFVPVVIVTHEVKEDNIRKAIVKIDNLSKVKKPSQIIRIEDL
jgi:homoserine dehydrogenase